jgi:hypothetical protein
MHLFANTTAEQSLRLGKKAGIVEVGKTPAKALVTEGVAAGAP